VVDWCFSRAVGGLVSRKPSPNEKWGRNPLPPGVRRPINLKVIRTFWEDFLGGVILPVWHPMTSFRTAWTALLVPFVMVSQEVGEVPWKRINPISGRVGNISERARFLHMILVPRCQKNTWEWELSTLDHLQNLLGDVLSACHSNCCGQILLVTWLPFQREMYQVSALCQYNSSTLAFFSHSEIFVTQTSPESNRYFVPGLLRSFFELTILLSTKKYSLLHTYFHIRYRFGWFHRPKVSRKNPGTPAYSNSNTLTPTFGCLAGITLGWASLWS